MNKEDKKAKPHKVYISILKVRFGSLGGLTDMLRYENCVPRTEDDSRVIQKHLSMGKLTAEDHVIELKRFSMRPLPPHDRWASFYCKVLEWRWVES